MSHVKAVLGGGGGVQGEGGLIELYSSQRIKGPGSWAQVRVWDASGMVGCRWIPTQYKLKLGGLGLGRMVSQ